MESTILSLGSEPSDRASRRIRFLLFLLWLALALWFCSTHIFWRDEVRAFCKRHVSEPLRSELRQAGNEGDGPLAKAFHKALFKKK